MRQRVVHGLEVHLDDFLALFAVGFLDGILDGLDGLVARQHAGQREETNLHDGVDASAHAAVARHLGRVNHEKLRLLRDERFLHRRRQLGPDFVLRVRRVQQERAARHQRFDHVVPLQEHRLMTRDEIRLADQIRRTNRLRPEPQMRHRHAAGFLRVINEIALRVIVRLLRR